MKKNVHPKYQQVLFVDSATGSKFVCGSTIATEEKDTFNGKTYPVCRVSISSASHPFFTGSKQLVDSEGRVDKFKKRYAAKVVEKKDDSQEENGEESKEEKKAPAKKAPAKKAAKK
jgi:large subunit ribosomal protein L31